MGNVQPPTSKVQAARRALFSLVNDGVFFGDFIGLKDGFPVFVDGDLNGVLVIGGFLNRAGLDVIAQKAGARERKRKWLAWAYLLLTDSDTATNTYFVTDSACNCQLHSRPYQPPTTSSFLADCQGLGKFYIESGGNIQQSLRIVTNYKILATKRINADTPSRWRSAERIKYKKHPTSNRERPTSNAGQFGV